MILDFTHIQDFQRRNPVARQLTPIPVPIPVPLPPSVFHVPSLQIYVCGYVFLSDKDPAYLHTCLKSDQVIIYQLWNLKIPCGAPEQLGGRRTM